MRLTRQILVCGAFAGALVLSACAPAAAPVATSAPVPKPTEAAKPVAPATTAPAAAASPSVAAKPAAATTPSATGSSTAPSAQPAASPAAAPPVKPAGFPSGAIQILVPFDPGGGADASQRVFNKYAEPIVGQPLSIVNKAGAGGVTGWAELVRARPDGSMLTIVTPPFNVLPTLIQPRQTPYTMDQFTNICIYAIVPDVLYVREDSQFKTLKDLVDYATANPQKIKAANTGTAGADHMTTLLIENATGTQFTAVPFTGGAESLQATLAGTTDVMVGSTAFVTSQQGKLRPLAITTAQRDPKYPDVPTFRELGYDVVAERYRALAGPPNLPSALVNYWGEVCKQVVNNPQFRDEMDKQGQPAAYRGPEEATNSIKQMTTNLQMLVAKFGLAKP